MAVGCGWPETRSFWEVKGRERAPKSNLENDADGDETLCPHSEGHAGYDDEDVADGGEKDGEEADEEHRRPTRFLSAPTEKSAEDRCERLPVAF